MAEIAPARIGFLVDTARDPETPVLARHAPDLRDGRRRVHEEGAARPAGRRHRPSVPILSMAGTETMLGEWVFAPDNGSMARRVLDDGSGTVIYGTIEGLVSGTEVARP